MLLPLLVFHGALLAPSPLPQETAPAELRYPPSTALAEGVDPERLAGLDSLVRSLVEDEEVVGAELLVIKNGRTLLHEAYGWADAEAQEPLQTGRLYCVRSMTKPLVGLAVQMLVEEDRVELGDRVSAHLPAFDTEALRTITVEQLLTHTSGLPMSAILAENPRDLTSVRAVADRAPELTLEFEPGAGFRYSDQGTDTLTALVEVVTGAPAEEFVAERILGPLGMRESVCLMPAEGPLRERALTKYAGGSGAWSAFWRPVDTPLFPVFLGSQSLYSTTLDYARFLEFWLQRGRFDGERLIRPRTLRRVLRPATQEDVGPSGFPGLRAGYGQMMQLWMGADEDGDEELVAFGHTGSDGTHAWAFPEERAMVLYFTQSRGSISGLRVEEHLASLFLGAPFDPLQAAPPVEEYLGYYRTDPQDLYRAVVRDGDGLALEILGKAVVPLVYVGEDRWKMRPDPRNVLEFQRDAEGRVTGYHLRDVKEFRFDPADDTLPTFDAVAEAVVKAHQIERLADAGIVRTEGRISIETLGVEATSTSWFAWPDRWRSDERNGEGLERTAYDGADVWSRSGEDAARRLEGDVALSHRFDGPFVRFGDWRRSYPEGLVVQEVQREDEHAWIVRTGGLDGPARTLYVDAETGHVGREDAVVTIPGMGAIGRRMSFVEFEDMGGARLPSRTRIQLANPMIGTILVTTESVELVEELPAGGFGLDG